MTAIEGIRGVLDRRDDVRLAYVFGSVARGRARPRSDVDVAVLFERESTPRVLDHLTEDLEDVAGRRVDLIDLATAPPLLAHQVVSTVTCIADIDLKRVHAGLGRLGDFDAFVADVERWLQRTTG